MNIRKSFHPIESLLIFNYLSSSTVNRNFNLDKIKIKISLIFKTRCCSLGLKYKFHAIAQIPMLFIVTKLSLICSAELWTIYTCSLVLCTESIACYVSHGPYMYNYWPSVYWINSLLCKSEFIVSLHWITSHIYWIIVSLHSHGQRNQWLLYWVISLKKLSHWPLYWIIDLCTESLFGLLSESWAKCTESLVTILSHRSVCWAIGLCTESLLCIESWAKYTLVSVLNPWSLNCVIGLYWVIRL